MQYSASSLSSDRQKGLHFRFRPYDLHLRHPFTLATSSRTSTPVMLTELEYEGVVGYGEASMPPYLGESHQTAQRFLSKLNLSQFKDPFKIEEIIAYVDQTKPGNTAAKASVDIALHDLVGKLMKHSWRKIWKLDVASAPFSSFTIGIDSPLLVEQKLKEAETFKILKVKLGGGNNREMINTIRKLTDVPLCVDANQGWNDKHEALETIYWLNDQNVVFIEQPMPKNKLDEMAWLTQHSPLPTIADEAVRRLSDVRAIHQLYSGINVKLMKCTGMREAHEMIRMARSLNLSVMIGCMTETSCAVSAAAQLAPMCDWADLDGNLLIQNDVFEGVQIVDGKIFYNERPGIGVRPLF